MKIFIFIIFLLSLNGCTGSYSAVQRIDTKFLQPVSVYWSSEEIDEITQSLISSILKSSYFSTTNAKVCAFLDIQNHTYDHIDTKAITDAIKTGLIKTGKIRIIDIQKRKIFHRKLLQQEKNRKYYRQVHKIGRELGIDALFFGDLHAIYQKNSRTKDMYFVCTLNLVDVETAQLVWSEEVKIRKIYRRKLIGW